MHCLILHFSKPTIQCTQIDVFSDLNWSAGETLPNDPSEVRKAIEVLVSSVVLQLAEVGHKGNLVPHQLDVFALQAGKLIDRQRLEVLEGLLGNIP